MKEYVVSMEERGENGWECSQANVFIAKADNTGQLPDGSEAEGTLACVAIHDVTRRLEPALVGTPAQLAGWKLCKAAFVPLVPSGPVENNIKETERLVITGIDLVPADRWPTSITADELYDVVGMRLRHLPEQNLLEIVLGPETRIIPCVKGRVHPLDEVIAAENTKAASAANSKVESRKKILVPA